MQKKIFYSIFLSCIGLLIIGNIFLVFVLESFFTKIIFNELKKEAMLLSELDDKLLSLSQSQLSHYLSHRISLIDEKGEVIYDNFATYPLENHSSREEFKQAINENEGFYSRYSNTLKQDYLYYARKISFHNQNYILRLSTAKSSVFSLIFAILPFIAIEFTLCLIICFILARYLSNSILKPILKVDIKNLKKDSLYQELHSFIDKIKTQNKTIKNQFKKLKQKQREMLLLTQNISDGLILLDNYGKILSFNKSAQDIFIQLELILNITQINQELFKQKIVFLLQDFKQNKSSSHQEFFTFAKKEYEFVFSPIYSNTKFKGMLIIIRNLTKDKQMQKLRKEFSANVSHELKTPLTSILASSEMIKNNLIPQQDLPYFIDKIHTESKRLLSMIEEILMLTFFDEKNSEVHMKSKVSLSKIVQINQKHFEFLAREKDISFILECEECYVLGVEEFLQNMIYNLWDNAIKYNNHGGYVKVYLKNTQNGVLLSVEDNGVGIAKKHQERIFERFYCVDKSRSKKLGGTGLGLSIVKSIANYHQAILEVQSKENEGSKFMILFPR